ncbi:hypothetical protein NRIC_25420 [Enterococcus florum]|uniref:Uncharacterized protein n=1 Tax=Enterococcus florum TaxID=2480627 RepID=A0A4P5PEB6_9ENTE|nr:DUF1694 domain-containing protein [Enterococcus florum]GCF94651.1 hypothetical protein NRIC_25420 [Enterococcus florum]
MIKKIQQYILQHQKNANRPVIESDLLLGSNSKKIMHFITFKDFHKNISGSIKKLKTLLSHTKGKLLINGNLQQKYISKLMKLIIRENGDFTIVVNDGYRLSKTSDFEKSSHIAVILEPQTKR